MKILAIETSCDDTGIAILEASANGSFKVLANIVSSQTEVHQKYGGVFPAMAKREHQRNILPSLIHALKEACMLKPDKSPKGHFDGPASISQMASLSGILEREPELLKKIIPFFKKYKKPTFDLIAVTNGPGLEPCLWVGVNFAKTLSYFWNIPVVPVNHIESHILVNFLNKKLTPNPSHKTRDSVLSDTETISFPAIALIVSGGHTQIILVNGIGKYKILGETRDDAAGECFDKCAKILGLAYPGGPIISKLAEGITPKNTLPRPMMMTKDYDFSFSGLKTAVLYADKKIINKTAKYKREMAAEVQQAIIDVLIKKTIKAVKNFNAKSLILGGGVSANKELRKQFQNKLDKELPDTKFLAPKPDLSTDNALMTAITGFYHKKKIKDWQKIKADSNLRVK